MQEPAFLNRGIEIVDIGKIARPRTFAWTPVSEVWLAQRSVCCVLDTRYSASPGMPKVNITVGGTVGLNSSKAGKVNHSSRTRSDPSFVMQSSHI